MNRLLSCRKLIVGYRGRPLLPAIDLEIAPGELWAVIGRNGSGKTTWLRTLLGLLPAVSGSVERAAAELAFSYLPQRQTFDELHPLLVRDVVAMGLDRNGSFLWPRHRDAWDKVDRALDRVGARELATRRFQNLSEGQKQRVLFARVAAAEPVLAVLDEPTSAMDLVAEREAYQLLRRLVDETGMSLIVVSHFMGLASEYADRALFLDRDIPAVVVGTPADVLGHEAFRLRYVDSASALERGADVEAADWSHAE